MGSIAPRGDAFINPPSFDMLRTGSCGKRGKRDCHVAFGSSQRQTNIPYSAYPLSQAVNEANATCANKRESGLHACALVVAAPLLSKEAEEPDKFWFFRHFVRRRTLCASRKKMEERAGNWRLSGLACVSVVSF